MENIAGSHNVRNRVLVCVMLVLTASGSISIAYGIYMKCKAVFAQELLKGSWAKVLAGQKSAKPWPWADTSAFARIEVPSYGVDEIVLDGGNGRTLAFGPGHIDGTASPGAIGNCAIIGHRDTSFGFLEQLKPGDSVYVTSKRNVKHKYVVTCTRIATNRDSWVMSSTSVSALTLITCFPFDSPIPGSGRYIVRALLESEAALYNREKT